MKVCLVGTVDKRVISYPLIKCMMVLGKTLIIADDGVYRRFSDELGLEFSLENADFIVTPKVTEEILSQVKKVEDVYSYILFITADEIPSDCDKVIYARGVNKSIISDDSLVELENQDYKEVYITFSRLENSKLLKIEPNRNVLEYVFACEEAKEFLTTKNAGFVNIVSSFFGERLGLNKTQIKSMLLR